MEKLKRQQAQATLFNEDEDNTVNTVDANTVSTVNTSANSGVINMPNSAREPQPKAFIIRRATPAAKRIQVGYRLRQDTVEKLEYLASEARKDVNVLVQELFDAVLDNVEIR